MNSKREFKGKMIIRIEKNIRINKRAVKLNNRWKIV